MDSFVAEAETPQERDYLQVQVHVSKGCHAFGFLKVLSPFFNNLTKTYEFIPIEKYVRDRLRNLPNAYCLFHLTTCCEIEVRI